MSKLSGQSSAIISTRTIDTLNPQKFSTSSEVPQNHNDLPIRHINPFRKYCSLIIGPKGKVETFRFMFTANRKFQTQFQEMLGQKVQ